MELIQPIRLLLLSWNGFVEHTTRHAYIIQVNFISRTVFIECCLYLDNRVFTLVSKQTKTISNNQSRDEKANLRNKKLLTIHFFLVSILIG